MRPVLRRREFGLIPGGDAGSESDPQGRGRIVRRLKEEGRPLAKVTARDVVADHDTGTLDVTLTVAAGPVAGYGETTVTGTEAMDPGFTAYMTGPGARQEVFAQGNRRRARPAARRWASSPA